MDLTVNIIDVLKDRCMNNNPVKYINEEYDVNELLNYLNISKEECKVLYLSKTVSNYIESTYNIETESVIKIISDNNFCLINNTTQKDNKTYIIEDCNLLDLNIFNQLLSILSKEANIVLIGDKNMLSFVDNNAFDLTSNVIAQKYLDKIKLEKTTKNNSITAEKYNEMFKPKCILDNLVKVNDDWYSGIVNWSEFKQLLKKNDIYNFLEEAFNSSKLCYNSLNYLKKFIANPYAYFQRTTIMSTKNDVNYAVSKGVVTSNFLNTYYHIKVEDMKAKFIELEYPFAKDIPKLDLPLLDKRIMLLIEQQFRIKYGSDKEFFKNEFFSLVSLDIDIILNQDKKYIFEYALLNPDIPMFIENKDIIRLATLKCYNLLNLKKLNKDYFNNTPYINIELNKNKDANYLLKKYNYYDNELEIIYNLPYTIFNLINWQRLSKEMKRFNDDKLFVSDLGLSLLNIEKIINFKLNMVDIMFKKYDFKGLDLIFKGKEDALFFNSLFKAINKNSYEINKSIKYNINKICEDNFIKIKKEFINSGDILRLDEFLEIKSKLKSDLYNRPSKALEYGFVEILNKKNIDWQKLFKKNN